MFKIFCFSVLQFKTKSTAATLVAGFIFPPSYNTIPTQMSDLTIENEIYVSCLF